MSTRAEQQSTWWMTPKAYAAVMGLSYPIVMRKDEPKSAKVTITVVHR